MLSATPHNSSTPPSEGPPPPPRSCACEGRGVPGEECVWKEGGGEFGTEIIDGAPTDERDVGTPEL